MKLGRLIMSALRPLNREQLTALSGYFGVEPHGPPFDLPARVFACVS